jgi:hypothetical protein
MIAGRIAPRHVRRKCEIAGNAADDIDVNFVV